MSATEHRSSAFSSRSDGPIARPVDGSDEAVAHRTRQGHQCRCAAKFKARYATLGFNAMAALDDGAIWSTAFAITELTPRG